MSIAPYSTQKPPGASLVLTWSHFKRPRLLYFDVQFLMARRMGLIIPNPLPYIESYEPTVHQGDLPQDFCWHTAGAKEGEEGDHLLMKWGAFQSPFTKINTSIAINQDESLDNACCSLGNLGIHPTSSLNHPECSYCEINPRWDGHLVLGHPTGAQIPDRSWYFLEIAPAMWGILSRTACCTWPFHQLRPSFFGSCSCSNGTLVDLRCRFPIEWWVAGYSIALHPLGLSVDTSPDGVLEPYQFMTSLCTDLPGY